MSGRRWTLVVAVVAAVLGVAWTLGVGASDAPIDDRSERAAHPCGDDIGAVIPPPIAALFEPPRLGTASAALEPTEVPLPADPVTRTGVVLSPTGGRLPGARVFAKRKEPVRTRSGEEFDVARQL